MGGRGKVWIFFSWKNFHLHVRKLRNFPTKTKTTKYGILMLLLSTLPLLLRHIWPHLKNFTKSGFWCVWRIFNVVTGDLSDFFSKLGTTLEEAKEALSLMVTGPSLVLISQIMIVFKEKFQEEIIIMPQSWLKNIIISQEKLYQVEIKYCLKTISSTQIILQGYWIIEIINSIVKKTTPLLQTSSKVPFLENACCDNDKNRKTIDYFISKDDNIRQYINIAAEVKEFIERTINISKPQILFHSEFTGISYPSISSNFTEELMYHTFIHYCNLNNNRPIPIEFRHLMQEKIENLNEYFHKNVRLNNDSRPFLSLKNNNTICTYKKITQICLITIIFS